MNLHRELDGTLDKVKHMYRWPDIRTIGIQLDVPKGLLVKAASGAAQGAGMRAGDRIAGLDGTSVWTFGDLQYYFDKVDRKAKRVTITVERDGKPADLAIALPERWWYTDIRFRQMTIDPRVFFDSRPLTVEEKTKHGFDAGGFASEVKHVDMFAEAVKSHALKVGDVVFGVDGVERDEIANTAELFIKLRKKAGDGVTLDVLRNGKRMQMTLKTYRMSFRK